MSSLNYDYSYKPGNKHGVTTEMQHARRAVCFGSIYTVLPQLASIRVFTRLDDKRQLFFDGPSKGPIYTAKEFADVFAALGRAGIRTTVECDITYQDIGGRYETQLTGAPIPAIGLVIPTDQSSEAIQIVLNTLRLFQEAPVYGGAKAFLKLLQECPDEHPLNLLLVAHHSWVGGNGHTLKTYEGGLFELHDAEWWQREIIESTRKRYYAKDYLPRMRGLESAKIYELFLRNAHGTKILETYRQVLAGLKPELAKVSKKAEPRRFAIGQRVYYNGGGHGGARAVAGVGTVVGYGTRVWEADVHRYYVLLDDHPRDNGNGKWWVIHARDLSATQQRDKKGRFAPKGKA